MNVTEVYAPDGTFLAFFVDPNDAKKYAAEMTEKLRNPKVRKACSLKTIERPTTNRHETAPTKKPKGRSTTTASAKKK